MTIDLPVIWFAIIVFATLMYIVMGWVRSGRRYPVSVYS
ncbi:terminal oxidase subunit II [Salmonella enterica subsp. enterica]|nr:terminal oxidase subunit II [Salmonella enterica subsp. enterica]